MSFLKVKNKLAQIKFVKDSLWTISSHVFVSVSGLIINSILGVKYLAEGLGIFSQSLSIYLLFTLLANFGIQTSAQKHAAQHSIEKEKLKLIFTSLIFSTGFISILITSLLVFILNVFPLSFSSLDVVQFLKILCFSIPLFSINKSINNFLAGLRIFKVYSFIRIMRWLLILIGIIVISSNNNKFNTIAYLFFFIEVVLFFYLIFRCNSYWTKPSFKWIKIHLNFGVKNLLADFISTFNHRVHIIILGYLLGNAAAGYYTYLESFGKSILMISSALQKNINSIFTKLWFDRKMSRIEEIITRLFRYSTFSILPISIGIFGIFLGYTSVFMTSDFLELWRLLLVFFLGSGVMYLFGPFFTFLIMTGHLYWNLFRVIIFAILNIWLTILSIGYLGLIGVPLAYFLCVIVNLFLLIQLYKRLLNINLLKCTIFQFIQFNSR